MKLSTLATSCLAASMFAANAYAVDVEWSGFASIVGGKTLDDDEVFIADRTFGSEGIYDNNLSFRPESVMALQARAEMSENLSATAQLLAKGQKQYDVSLEWLYLTYQLTDETAVKAGRFRLPFYYYSDFLDVGYAYYWVRAPIDVYSIGHTAIDGVTLNDSRYIGDFGLTSQVWFGSDDLDFNGIDTYIKNDYGLTFTLEYEWAKLRYAYNNKDVIAQYTADNTPGVGEVELVALTDLSYNAFSFIVDYDNFMFRTEYTRLDYTYDALFHATSTLNVPVSTDIQQDSWYASVGYRIGQFTPYYTYAFMEEGIGMPAGETNSDAVGVRWDLQPGMALKLEYSDQDVKELVLPDTTVIPAATNKLITVAVDVVF